jgi:hypothetical protein
VERTANTSRGLRVVALSAISGFAAPLVFVSVIVLRKAERRVNSRYKHLNKRLQREISRWT